MAGCGGSSISSRSTGGSSTSTQVSLLSANLNAKGAIETSYITGAGRDGDFITVLLSEADYTDNLGNTVYTTPAAPIGLTLNNYGGPVVIRTSITFGPSTNPLVPSTNPNSRLFPTFDLSIAGLSGSVGGVQVTVDPSEIFVGSGDYTADQTTTGQIGTGAVFSRQSFPAQIRAFPGRVSTINVRLDQTMFGINVAGSVPAGFFEENAFNASNINAAPNVQFQGALSDFMSFDLSSMPSNLQPETFVQSGIKANRIFFSGDGYATADASTGGTFHELTETIGNSSLSAITGTYSLNNSLTTGTTYSAPGNFTTTLPGTYALTEVDPSDPAFLRQIVSQEGMFRDYTQLLNAVPQTVAITFPSTSDNSVQDLVVVRSTTVNGVMKVKDMYYGYIDMEAQQVFLYPLVNLPYASITNPYTQASDQITGTVAPGSLLNSAGVVTSDAQSVRSGTIALSTPITFADGSTYSGGSFIVFRK
jgi:hypothetical protein